MLALANEAPFARGGNRLCYVHPEDPSRCIKVRRPDFTLEDRRRKKGFPKNLRPLSSFDDNLEENRVMRTLDKLFGEPLYAHVSRCFGFQDTDIGKGLVSELIRDDSGRIAQTLKKLIWDDGYTDDIQRAVNDFAEFWIRNGVPSRDLLLHNIAAPRDMQGQIRQLVVIDGLGSSGLLPMQFTPKALRCAGARRKIVNLNARIQTLEGQRGEEKFPGYHGELLHDDAPASKERS